MLPTSILTAFRHFMFKTCPVSDACRVGHRHLVFTYIYMVNVCRYPLVLITMYNTMDLISSYIPLIKCLKMESRKGLLVATLSRFLLIPAFYFTAKYGAQGWMILLVSFLGLTNGYLTVCVYTVVPKGYKVSVFL